MSYTIEATVPFDYRIQILPVGRLYLMGEIYDVTIEDPTDEIPKASFSVNTAKTAGDEALLSEDVAIEIRYNGAVRFQGVINRVLKREDAPIWEIDAEGGLSLLEDEGVTEVEEFVDTPGNGIIAALMPGSWTVVCPTLPAMSFKAEYSTILENVRKVVKNAGYEMAASYAAGWILTISPAIGSLAPVTTWRINHNLMKIQREQDKIRNPTVAICPGATADTQDRGAVIARFAAHEALTVIDEPWLTESIDEAATEIPCSWTEGLTEGGSSGIVHIGAERIAFSGMTADTLTGCIRGYQNTTAAPHDAGDGVLRVISFPLSDTTGWPLQGSFWCGAEKIHYANVGIGMVYGLSRGHPENGAATPAYNHRDGILVILCDDGTTTYSKDNPAPGSPIATYGVRTVRIDGTGLNDQSALDLAATRKLLGAAGTLEGGAALLMDTSFRTNIVTGDHVSVTEADGSATTTYRITKLTFSMSKGTIELGFNQPREFYQEDLNNNAQTRTRTDSRAPLGDLGTVALIAADKTTMLVTKKDGTQVWAACGLRPAL